MRSTLPPIKQRKMARIRAETVADLRRRYMANYEQSEALGRDLLANPERSEEEFIEYIRKGKELHADSLRLLNAALPLATGREQEALAGLKEDLELKGALIKMLFPEARDA